MLNMTLPSLDHEKIVAWCTSFNLGKIDVEVVAETASTNSDLMARIANLTRPLLLVADNQTAGRGRLGRAWVSAQRSGLLFSLAWRFGPDTGLSGLSLAIGVALAQILDTLGVKVQLKWPNDLLKEGNKLAGILIESAHTQDRHIGVVIGVGLNLIIPPSLEMQLKHPIADARWLAQMDRHQLLVTLVHAIINALILFESAGLTPFVEAWNQYHAYAHQQVGVYHNGVLIKEGVALGINHLGHLSIQNHNGHIDAILAGEVSLRLL